jgi:hypothetical protein
MKRILKALFLAWIGKKLINRGRRHRVGEDFRRRA